MSNKLRPASVKLESRSTINIDEAINLLNEKNGDMSFRFIAPHERNYAVIKEVRHNNKKEKGLF